LVVASTRIEELERRWSRFRDDSEVSALNRHAGASVLVSRDTFTLVEQAIAAWRLTGGRFDPTVGAALVAHGYDRDFAGLSGLIATTREPRPVPGPVGIELDPALPSVALPAGVSFDPGGIGKGLAADLIAGELLSAGAAGALVNLGGDLRAAGEPPASEGWVIGVPDPALPGHELVRVALTEGAVASSSPLRRRWRTTGGEAHHLIDPVTAEPAHTGVAGVTVVAAEAWRAEALTKALFLAGPADLIRYPDVHALIVTDDGRRHATGGLARLLR
ncbi:MAG TPA: FAD:protein FMN transferase, partial [Acidimicrobiia bacterium]